MRKMNDFEAKFGIIPAYSFNDYSLEQINDTSLFTELSLMRVLDKSKFEHFKKYLAGHKPSRSNTNLLLKAYVSYIDENFKDATDACLTLLERYPTDINRWNDVIFSLLHDGDNYDLALDIIFNLPYFIQYSQKYDFSTLNRRTIRLLSQLIKLTENKTDYIWPVTQSEEFLTISRRCNNNCSTCPSPFGLRDCSIKDFCDTELALFEYVNSKIQKEHITRLTFTGGEPTLTPTFFGILRHIYSIRPDLEVSVVTNGRLFSLDSYLKNLENLKVANIGFEVSLFSARRQIHDSITQVSGSFDQTMKGIFGLLRRGFSVTINILVCEKNYLKLNRDVDFAFRNFNRFPSFKGINLLLPVPSGNYFKKWNPVIVKKFHSAILEVTRFHEFKNRVVFRNEIIAKLL